MGSSIKKRAGSSRVSPHQKGPAVRQLDMGHLQLGALASQNRIILTPVELKGVARIKMQWNKGPTPHRLLLALTICPPSSRKGRYPRI